MPLVTLGIWERLARPFSILAPMEEVTDTVFRRIVREAGSPDLFFTEFTSTDGLCSAGRPRVIGRLRFMEEERPLIAQIWGNRPEYYLRVAAEIRGMGFDGIDINMGCPVKKVVARGACAGLINNPSLAAELIAAAKEGAGTLPVSVKTRIGIRSSTAGQWLAFLLEQGIAALTVHGRTVAQQSDGEADWSTVSAAVRIRDQMGLATRIIGNGDVKTPSMFLRRVKVTGADGIMIGRGVFENLFIFGAIRDALEAGDGAADSATGHRSFSELDPCQKVARLRHHLELHRATWGSAGRFDTLKKFAKTYLRAFEGASRLVDEVMHAHTYEAGLAVLDAWVQERQS